MAQFFMVGYFTLGGAYTLKEGEHVRMDLLYSGFTMRGKVEDRPVHHPVVLIGFLVMLQIGGISSLIYAFQYGEKSFSAWAPLMWPVKVVINIGIFLTLLQAIAIFFKDWAPRLARGADRMSYGLIATLMFSSMMLLLLTGQRIFAVIGFVGAASRRSCCGARAASRFPSPPSSR